ncbi:hypothetical protein P3T22_000135 [Paraburkholderia sp. GAS348]
MVPHILTLNGFSVKSGILGHNPNGPEKPHLKNSAATKSERRRQRL